MRNLYDIKEKQMQGKVVVTTRPSYLIKGSTIQHVVRNTADDAVIATAMLAHTDIVKFNDMAVVMSAFVAGVKDLVANGNAVRISGLGTFYLTAKENEDGSSEFDIGFTADKELTESAKKAEAKVTMQSESAPAFESVINMETMEENGRISAGKFAFINGKRLRVAGDAEGTDGDSDTDANWNGTNGDGGGNTNGNGGGSGDGRDGGSNTNMAGASGGNTDASGGRARDTGLFMAPCDEYGNYKTDMSDWVRVEDKNIVRNFMTEVIFKVPDVEGRYRVVIATKAPLNGSTRADKLLKHARVGASGEVMVI